ncbi:sigma-70 family RNA polymerase sigma factor, partial [Nostoc sp. NIES-2111]
VSRIHPTALDETIAHRLASASLAFRSGCGEGRHGRLLRRPHVDIDDLDDVLEDDTPSPERQMSRIEEVRLVQEALDRMPDRQRAVIVLAHFQELGQAEASAIMGMSEHAYESLLARARRRLRGLLAGQRDEDGEDWT